MTAKQKPILQVAFENAISYACRPRSAGSVLMAAMARQSFDESPWDNVIFFLMREKPL